MSVVFVCIDMDNATRIIWSPVRVHNSNIPRYRHRIDKQKSLKRGAYTLCLNY